MTEQEELFAKFYNSEKILVKDMDDIQLREHRDELRQIAFEAKARAVAAEDENRERQAKSKNKEWLLTPTSQDQTATDAINAVKVRQARMSKMDKMRQRLLAAGIDEDTVKDMIRNLESKATEKSLKTVTFTQSATELKAVQVQQKKPNGDTTPFDPTKLFGKKE